MGGAGISLQVPRCRSAGRGNGQTSLQMTTWTVYKLVLQTRLQTVYKLTNCVRLCNTEVLSIALTSFLEEFLETKST